MGVLGCVRFPRYCGQMYSAMFFSCEGLRLVNCDSGELSKLYVPNVEVTENHFSCFLMDCENS